MKFFIIAFILLALPFQGLPQDATVRYLNAHVRYMNETIHVMWVMHHQWQEFRDDVDYYKKGPVEKLSNSNYWSVYHSGEDLATNRTYYYYMPAEQVAFIRENRDVPADVKKLLSPGFERLVDITGQLVRYTDSSYYYVQNKEYMEDYHTGFSRAYRFTDEVKRLFDMYDLCKDSLYTTIDHIYAGIAPKKNDTIMAVAKEMDAAIRITKRWIESVRYLPKEEQQPAAYKDSLDQWINYFVNARDSLLKGLSRKGMNHGGDVVVRYNFVIRDMEAMSAHIGRYLNTERVVHHKAALGIPYVYYNDYFLNKYNRYGVGLIQDYNKFIALSGNLLLEQVEEPHWLKYKEEEKKQLDSVVVSILPVDTVTKSDSAVVIDGYTLYGAEANNMVLLLDVSGSMNADEKLPLMKEAFRFLVELMRKQDMVSVITYSGTARIVLPPTSAENKEKITDCLDSLKSRGTTDVDKGIVTALKAVNKKYGTEKNNTVLMATDGLFSLSGNVKKQLAKAVKKDIHLVILYFGKDPRSESHVKSLAADTGAEFYAIHPSNIKGVLVKIAGGGK